jgi:hypothetical protein
MDNFYIGIFSCCYEDLGEKGMGRLSFRTGTVTSGSCVPVSSLPMVVVAVFATPSAGHTVAHVLSLSMSWIIQKPHPRLYHAKPATISLLPLLYPPSVSMVCRGNSPPPQRLGSIARDRSSATSFCID